MNTTITKNVKPVLKGFLAILLVSLPLMANAAFVPLTAQLGVGSSGTNVSNLQTFLASDSNIYPGGRVTGFYGALTKAAVMQFQLSYGLPMVGNVGPMTLQKINSVIARGYGLDIYAPKIYNMSLQKTNTSAVFSWSTTENATGKVYYSTSPLSVNEAVGNFTEPFINGGSMMPATNFQSSQSISINNLLPNTTYYYIIQVSDVLGNTSVTRQSTLTTNQ